MALTKRPAQYFGSSGNYMVVDSSGQVALEGNATQFNDLLAPALIGKPTSGGKPDYDYTNVGYLFPQNDSSETLQFTFQLPHNWKEGSTIYPHVHVQQAADQQAAFQITYDWANIGAAAAAPSPTYAMGTYVITYSAGTIHQILKGASGISGTGKTMSSMLKVILARTDNVYTGDMLVTAFDIHYEIDSFGSDTEYTK